MFELCMCYVCVILCIRIYVRVLCTMCVRILCVSYEPLTRGLAKTAPTHHPTVHGCSRPFVREFFANWVGQNGTCASSYRTRLHSPFCRPLSSLESGLGFGKVWCKVCKVWYSSRKILVCSRPFVDPCRV
jgi:hypothetical protein